MRMKITCFSMFLILVSTSVFAVVPAPNSEVLVAESYIEYKSTVVDRKTGTPLVFAHISVVGTNISTVTNTEGQFSLKIRITSYNVCYTKLLRAHVLQPIQLVRERQLSFDKFFRHRL